MKLRVKGWKGGEGAERFVAGLWSGAALLRTECGLALGKMVGRGFSFSARLSRSLGWLNLAYRGGGAGIRGACTWVLLLVLGCLPGYRGIALESSWKSTNNGNWDTANNWTTSIPQSTNDVAHFPAILGADRTATINMWVMLGRLDIVEDSNNYTIALGAGGTLVFDMTVGEVCIAILAADANRTHTISAPFEIKDNLIITNAPAGSSLVLSGAITGSGKTLYMRGSGTNTMSANNVSTLTGTIRVESGGLKLTGVGAAGATTVRIDPAAGQSRLYVQSKDAISNCVAVQVATNATLEASDKVGLGVDNAFRRGTIQLQGGTLKWNNDHFSRNLGGDVSVTVPSVLNVFNGEATGGTKNDLTTNTFGALKMPATTPWLTVTNQDADDATQASTFTGATISVDGTLEITDSDGDTTRESAVVLQAVRMDEGATLTVIGPGPLTIRGSNSASLVGNLAVTNGLLQVYEPFALGLSTTYVHNGGSLILAATNNAQPGAAFVLNSGGTFQCDEPNSLARNNTFSNVVVRFNGGTLDYANGGMNRLIGGAFFVDGNVSTCNCRNEVNDNSMTITNGSLTFSGASTLVFTDTDADDSLHTNVFTNVTALADGVMYGAGSAFSFNRLDIASGSTFSYMGPKQLTVGGISNPVAGTFAIANCTAQAVTNASMGNGTLSMANATFALTTNETVGGLSGAGFVRFPSSNLTITVTNAITVGQLLGASNETLTVTNGNLVMGPNASLYVEVGNRGTSDLLRVFGSATITGRLYAAALRQGMEDATNLIFVCTNTLNYQGLELASSPTGYVSSLLVSGREIRLVSRCPYSSTAWQSVTFPRNEGDNDFKFPERACADDTQRAESNLPTKDQRWGGCDFSVIPAGARVEGIQVLVDWSAFDDYVVSNRVEISNDGASFSLTRYSDTRSEKNQYSDSIFGGPADKWGLDWTTDSLTTNNFAVRLIATEMPRKILVDWIRAKVFYTVEACAVTNGIATNVTWTNALISGGVTSGIPTPQTRIYWGTNDGATTIGNWSNAVVMGAQSGAFSSNVTFAALANLTNYFRCYVSNAVNSSWASASRAFVTPPPFVRLTNVPYDVLETVPTGSVYVTMDIPSAIPVSVAYSTSGDTAVAGTDYTNVSGTITWAPGATGRQSFVIPIVNDSDSDPSEIFRVYLVPSNCLIAGDSSTNYIILDDDSWPSLQFATETSSRSETGETASIEVILQPNPLMTARADYVVTGGSALNGGVDYTLTNGTFEFAPGVGSQTISVSIVNDTYHESNETVRLILTNVSQCILGFRSSHLFSIEDEDVGIPDVDNWLGAAQITSTSATFRGQVTDIKRETPNVRIYWGWSDGGTNRSSWNSMIDMGSLGVSTFLTNGIVLNPGTTFYYRCYASNSAGAGWAPFTEAFIAVDPPVAQLLVNNSLETQDATADDAQYWARSDSTYTQRRNVGARSGTYSMWYSKADANNFLYSSGSNAFRLSLNGQLADGGVHPSGGIRPGFVATRGDAYVRAASNGYLSAQFQLRLKNYDDSNNWMSKSLSHTLTTNVVLTMTNPAPFKLSDLGDRYRVELERQDADPNSIDFYADDFSLSVGLPRLYLERNPTQIVNCGSVEVDSYAEVAMGAKNQGGDSTILYGAAITNAVDLTNVNWSATGWVLSNNTYGVYSLPSGGAIVATNNAGWQYTRIRFTPPQPDSYTSNVRVTTTDPSAWTNLYGTTNFGRMYNTLVYYDYTIIGRGTTNYPHLENDGVTNVGGLQATLLAYMDRVGADTTCAVVSVFWGYTDGGTNKENWSNTNVLGPLLSGAVSATIPVIPMTNYYYRFYATNSYGHDWANSSGQFSSADRLKCGTVNGATEIAITQAKIHGELRARVWTNATPATYFCWGPTNGGSNFASWARNVYMGVRTTEFASFSTNVTGFTAGSTNWYTVFVTNTSWSASDPAPAIAYAWATNSATFMTLRDDDHDGIADAWETNYFADLNVATTNSDSDGDSITDKGEYYAGTDPQNAGSNLKIVDVYPTNTDSIAFRVIAGSNRTTSISASSSTSNGFTDIVTISSPVGGTNVVIENSGALQGSRRFYRVSVSFDGSTYTNTTTWGMFRQPRFKGQKAMVALPVDLGTETNLQQLAGQELMRGLNAGNYGDGTADKLTYKFTNSIDYREFWLRSDGAGGKYWYEHPTGTADFNVAVGTTFWLECATNVATRTNAVFTGKILTPEGVASVTMVTNYGGWNTFSWPLPDNGRIANLGIGFTPSNQLGFLSNGAVGGTSIISTDTNQLGDQIWVWSNGTWRTYWLYDGGVGGNSSNFNGRWLDRAGNLADFSLEPGLGYYYYRTRNKSAGNFSWTPKP